MFLPSAYNGLLLHRKSLITSGLQRKDEAYSLVWFCVFFSFMIFFFKHSL